MSTQPITKKRKSVDGEASTSRKAKVVKSADKPAPIKSALKKSGVEMAEVKTKARSKPMIEAHEIKKNKLVAKPAKKPEKKEKIIIDKEDDEDGGTTLTPDQTASLLAGFSSESEDEGEGEGDDSEIPTSKLPKAPTTGDIQDRVASATAALKKNAASDNKDDPESTPGVIYIGRIPHGFHEPQMRSYFSQFGTLTHLKLARNRKTGRSKHFAFLEFASAAVADIVVKTMDKYLLFGHILQVRRVAPEAVGEGFWKGEGRKGWNVRPNNKVEGGLLRRGRTREGWEKRVEKEQRRREGKKEKLKDMGYEFEMPAVKGVGEVPVRGKVVEDVPAAVAAEAAPAEEIVEEVEVVGQDGDGDAVVEKKSTKKRAAEGKPKVKEAKKAVKKVKM